MGSKLSLIFVLFVITGCASITPKSSDVSPLFGDPYVEQLSQKYFSDNRLETHYRAKFEAYIEEVKHGPQAQRLRDEVIYDLISISDHIYNSFKNRLFTGKATFDSGFQTLNLALTGTAAAIADPVSKTALAAAATFLTGTKASINENLFANQTIATIIVTMDGKRAETKAKLIANLSKGPLDFTLAQGLASVQEYHRAGSMVDAIIQLQKISGANADKQEKLLQEVEDKKASIETERIKSLK